MSSSQPAAPSAAPKSDTPPPPSYWPFLLALSSVAGLAELAFIIVNVSTLPIYFKEGLGLPNLPGIALAAFYTAEALGNAPMGILADRLGRRRLMVTGALLSVGTCILTAFVRVPHNGGLLAWAAVGLLLLMRVFDGLGAAMLWPNVFAAVGDRVPAKQQAQAMTTLNIMYFVGIALGPLIGGIVNDKLGAHHPKDNPLRYAPSLFVAAFCFFLTAVIAFLVAPRRQHPTHVTEHPAPEVAAGLPAPEETSEPPKKILARALREFPMLMLMGFIIFLGVGLIAPYVKPFFLMRFHLEESEFGALLLVPALLIAGASLPLSKLSDRWGKPRAIHIGMGICALALWPILFMTHAWTVVLLGSLLGIGFMLAFPSYMAYLGELSGPNERGGTIGAVRMAQGVGALTGSALSSPLYTLDAQHLTLFIVAGVLLTIGWILSMIFVRERPVAATEATP
jgi:DHA1 family multidrug resistance protein-like MFS transporter